MSDKNTTNEVGDTGGKAASVPMSVPLEELIARIDAETGQFSSLTLEEGGEKQEVLDTSDHEQYIRFFLDETLFGIPLSSAVEIGQLTNITSLPNLPFWVAGISNIRGEIVSIVDLKGFFDWPTDRPKRGSSFIIVQNREMKVGIIVNRVMGILSLDTKEAAVQRVSFEEDGVSAFVQGMVVTEEHNLNIFDMDKFLSSPKMTAFRLE